MNIFNYVAVSILARFRRAVEMSPGTMGLLFIPGLERLRWAIGKMKAFNEFERARRTVPAYQEFISKHQRHSLDAGYTTFEAIPVMDKVNYIRRYSPAECCRYGIIPAKGAMVDESSGSTGVATNWVRGLKERRANKIMLEFALGRLIGTGPRFIVNAFALGPWATGINVSMAFADSSIMKSLGPDPAKIGNTLRFFGKSHRYVVMGYPPFLKLLVDTVDIDWHGYDITFIFGGESMSEEMRSYMITKGVKRVYGSYGASDLELNMGSENDFTIALRKLLATNEKLATKLVRYPGALPMIFQYSPLDFYIESNKEGELLITLCRPAYVAPKIRYNIHDRGYVVRLPELKRILKECGIDIRSIGTPASDLPLLFHFGRADMSVAYFGCKITPSDVQEVVFRIPDLAENTSAFTIITYEDSSINKQLEFSFELLPGRAKSKVDAAVAATFIDELKKLNQDFRESMRMVAAGSEPKITFHEYHSGPFAENDMRIKLKYITREIYQKAS